MSNASALQAPSIPGPKARELPKVLLSIRQNPLKGFSQLSLDHGEIAYLPAGKNGITVVRNHEVAKHILITNQDNYRKPIDYKAIGVALGKGLLTNPSDSSWRKQRKLIQPMFAKRHLEPFAVHMTNAVEQSISRIDSASNSQGFTDIGEEMTQLTLEVVCQALFGARLSDKDCQLIGDGATVALRASVAAIANLLPRVAETLPRVDLPGVMRTAQPIHWRRFQKAVADADSVVNKMISAQESGAVSDRQNLLALLMASQDEETGEKMSRTQVRDEIFTFLGAGHETTANTLSFMWMLLSQHPHIRDEMYAEIDSVLAGRIPTADDVDNLHLTKAVFNETLRLFPPAYAIMREPVEDDQLGDHHVKAGSPIIIFNYLIHRDPEIWPNPEGFDPRRFMPGADPYPRTAFLPFGAGRKVCIGQGFAIMEAVLITAMLAQRYYFDLRPGFEVEVEAALSMRPRYGVQMDVRPR